SGYQVLVATARVLVAGRSGGAHLRAVRLVRQQLAGWAVGMAGRPSTADAVVFGVVAGVRGSRRRRGSLAGRPDRAAIRVRAVCRALGPDRLRRKRTDLVRAGPAGRPHRADARGSS